MNTEPVAFDLTNPDTYLPTDWPDDYDHPETQTTNNSHETDVFIP